MLIGLPEEMLQNPDCYTIKDGVKGYFPTPIATEEERRAIEKYNRDYEKASSQRCVIINEEEQLKIIERLKAQKEAGVKQLTL